MEAYIVHVESCHSKTLDPNSFCTSPVVVDVIKHIMSYTSFPQIDLPGAVTVPVPLHELRHLRLRQRLPKQILPASPTSISGLAIPVDARGGGGGGAVPGPVKAAGAEGREPGGLAEPDGPPGRVSLRVGVPEVEGQVGVRRLVGDDLGSPGFGLRRRRRLRRVVWDSRERRVVVVGVGEVGGAQEAAGQSLGLWASGARP